MGACLSDLCAVEERPPLPHYPPPRPAGTARTHPEATAQQQRSSGSRESPGKPRHAAPHAAPATITSRPPHAPPPPAAAEHAAVGTGRGVAPAAGGIPTALSWVKGEMVGSGAFGRVYRCLSNQTGELIAVKQVALSKDEAASRKVSEHVRALEVEVDLLKTLRHENIVQYLGVERTADAVNILLEYVPGGSIANLLHRFGPLKENVVQIYTRQILQGLHYLHAKGIMHRDIKGANILLDNKGTIKLADFGASKHVEDLATIANGANSVRGTPYWMAPEVIKGEFHGRPADIWSLGCTVIEMATGKPPWCNYAAPVSAMFQIASAQAPPPFPEALSRDAHDFLARCFNRTPNQRPTAAMLLEHPFIAGAPPRAAAGVQGAAAAAQQQQQQQQQGVPAAAPAQQQQHGGPGGRLPPQARAPGGKATPSRLSPTKRCAQPPAQEATAQLAAGHRPPVSPGGVPAQQQQQQQPLAGPARPGGGAQQARPPLAPEGPVAVQQPAGAAPGRGTAHAQAPLPPPAAAAAGLPGPLASPLTRGLGVRQSAAPAGARAAPPPGSVFNSLVFNPMSEPSWSSSAAPALPAGQQQAGAPGVPTVLEDAVLSLTSSTGASAGGGLAGSSRTSSRRTTVYDDDADQHVASRPAAAAAAAGSAAAAARPSPRSGRASPAKGAGADRKQLTPRGGAQLLAAADAAALLEDRDTESDVDQPARPSSASPQQRGAPKGAAGARPPRPPAAADRAGSQLACSKQQMYIEELDAELVRAKAAMRATMQMGRAQ
jgi:hypothetical protein